MPNANEVRPKKWRNISVLFDNDIWSVIVGNYEGGATKTIGVRWNTSKLNPMGYPTLCGNPVWFNLPKELNLGFLGVLQAQAVEAHARKKLSDDLYAKYASRIHRVSIEIQGTCHV